MFKKNLTLACFILILGMLGALKLPSAHATGAGVSPLSLAIIPPVQFPPEDFTVTGLRLSVLWGQHQSVYGFDIGAIGNISNQGFGGLAVAGGFNSTYNSANIVGLQFAGITNLNHGKTKVVGLQLAGLYNSNSGESSVIGLQLSAVNNSPFTTIGGLQVGLYNKAREVYGLQIGIINVTEILHGLQIGLINFNKTGVFSIAPILNFGF